MEFLSLCHFANHGYFRSSKSAKILTVYSPALGLHIEGMWRGWSSEFDLIMLKCYFIPKYCLYFPKLISFLQIFSFEEQYKLS